MDALSDLLEGPVTWYGILIGVAIIFIAAWMALKIALAVLDLIETASAKAKSRWAAYKAGRREALRRLAALAAIRWGNWDLAVRHEMELKAFQKQWDYGDAELMDLGKLLHRQTDERAKRTKMGRGVVALIISVLIVVSAITCTYLVMHYSPYATCVRLMEPEEGPTDSAAVCAHHLSQ